MKREYRKECQRGYLKGYYSDSLLQVNEKDEEYLKGKAKELEVGPHQ